jgi:hypothetical protein
MFGRVLILEFEKVIHTPITTLITISIKMKNQKYKIDLSVEEKEELNRLVRKQSVSQNIAKRAKLILLVAEEKQIKRQK